MANQLYPGARRRFLEADIDVLVNDIRVMFLDTTADPIDTANVFVSDMLNTALIGENGVALTSDGAITANTPSLASKTTTVPADGTFDAADTTFSSVTGVQFEAIILFDWQTAVSTTAPLVAAIDTATGLPATPNGGDITVAWDSGTDRIFTL